MSIRAYLIERKRVDSDKENYDKIVTYRHRTPFFNVWRTTNLIDIFQLYGFDGTNNDCIGEFELSDDQFEEFLKDFDDNTRRWSEYDFEILEKIKNYFNEGHWLLTLETY